MAESRFHTLLKVKIDEVILATMQNMSVGIKGKTNYWDEVGYLRGMRDCITLCDEVEKEFK